MENKLYIIGIKCSLEDLANKIGFVDEGDERYVAYFGFWENIVFVEYNQDTHEYTVKENVDGEIRYYKYDTEKELFRHMDSNGIDFIYDLNPMGDIYRSYSAAYLEVVRWAADVAWTREKYFNLMEG